QRRIGEVDRGGIVRHAARSRGRGRPTIRAAVVVKPSGDLRVSLAHTVWRNGDADTDGKALFGDSDHLARVVGILDISHSFFWARSRCPAGWASSRPR